MNQIFTCFSLMPWHSVLEAYKGLMKPGSNPKLFLWKQALAVGKAVNQSPSCCVWDMFGYFQHLAARLPNQPVSQDLVLLTEFFAHWMHNAGFDCEKQAGMIFLLLYLIAETACVDFCYVVAHYIPFFFSKRPNPQVRKPMKKQKTQKLSQQQQQNSTWS